MSEYSEFLRNNLKSLRVACGFTQNVVAAALGVSRPTYSYYESGKTVPDVETLTKLAKIYGVSFGQLALPEESPELAPQGVRARHTPAADPRTIGDLSEAEKELIARLRAEKP